ncbi:WXG100 family type VII secretion target [Actinosynnema sp. NPDC091369]
MVTNLTPTTLSTPPPGGGSGFTMDESAIDSLQQQADTLRTGYQEVSSTLSGQTLAGNAFGTVGTFAAEAFNAAHGKSVELAGKAASTLGLVGEGLKATARTHLEADRANGEQFTSLERAEITDGPQGAPSGGPTGTPTPQGPPVTPTEQLPGASGGGNPSQPASPPPETSGTTTGQNSTPPPTTQPAPVPDFPEVPDPQAATPTGSTGGGNPSQPASPPPETSGTTTGQNSTPPPTTQPAPVPDFPEVPDPQAAIPTGSAGGGTASGGSPTTPPAGTTPPPMPPIPEAPNDLFKQPGIPDSGTGGSSAGTTPPPTPSIPEVPKEMFNQPGMPDLGTGGGTGGPSGGGTATSPSAGTTPPPMPPIPEVPKDLFKQPGIPDLGTATGSGSSGSGSGTPAGTATSPSTGTTPPPMPPIPEVPKDLFKQPGIPDLGTGGSSGGGAATSPSTGTTPPTTPPIPEVPKDLFERPGMPEPGAGLPSTGGGADTPARPDTPGIEDGDRKPGESDDRERTGEERPDRDALREVRHERDEHGFPITSVDGKPCLDLRDLPAEEGERWQENIRDILATKGEGSFFWAGDTIDAEGRRHSLMDLAEFMTNLDSRPDTTDQAPRELSDTVTDSPARSANGDVYVLLGPNRAEDGPVDLADFPTLQGNPRIERVFAIDAVTGRETQIHPKVT